MKKILVTILTVAMMTSAVAAFADGAPMLNPMGGKPPRMEQGQQPPEKPSGDKPADAPEMPSDKQDQAPTDGQQPTDGQRAPKMIDFDAMVTSGVISQETRDAIRAYMDEHKPKGEMPAAPVEGEAPDEGEPNLLNDLLNAEIITQAEYESLSSAA